MHIKLYSRVIARQDNLQQTRLRIHLVQSYVYSRNVVRAASATMIVGETAMIAAGEDIDFTWILSGAHSYCRNCNT